MSIVTPHELNAMLTSKAAPPRLLADNTRVVNDWPAKTDSWVYSPGYAGWGPDYISTGGAVGSLGVRESGGQLEQGRGPEGVAHLGAVDGDACDAFCLVVEDVLKTACWLPIHVHAWLILKAEIMSRSRPLIASQHETPPS